MNEKEVVDLMASSNTADEWNANCDKVKKACGGYPDFWYRAIIQSGVARETTAKFGETTDLTLVSQRVRSLENIYGRPMSMPYLHEGETLVGIYDQGLGEKQAPCPTLEDMQRLYDSYAAGYALSLKWVAVSTSETTIKN